MAKAWCESVDVNVYEVKKPGEKNPIWAHHRVYQGSCGKVYPLPLIEGVAADPVKTKEKAWFLENDHVKIMVIPSLGGRIHRATHKSSGSEYDFFYTQPVIKPALVGLAGPWISGGVEFNFPQHHRPTTHLPVDVSVEQEDGKCILWMSEHEPMNRIKGMVGLALSPNSSVIEALVRLSNRTSLTQTFMWWANVAVLVNDSYQSFFPSDVHEVADHADRAISSYPVARNLYYGVDYRPGTDLRWFKNISVPTSFMVRKSDYDFFGGYDHEAQHGFVHVADHHVVPGKKQWTWGNDEFGRAWDRELTDADKDGRFPPYIELMAGAFTNNQVGLFSIPDFSYLLPYEVKQFTQCWWPYQHIGPLSNASKEMAISLRVDVDEPGQESTTVGHIRAQLGLAVSQSLSCTVALMHAVPDDTPGSWTVSEIGSWDNVVVTPAQPWQQLHDVELSIPAECDRSSWLGLARISLHVGGTFEKSSADEPSTSSPSVDWNCGLCVLEEHCMTAHAHYTHEGPAVDASCCFSCHVVEPASPSSLAGPAIEPPVPRKCTSVDELFLIGEHLSLYRHPTRAPEAYWQEALHRDALDMRCNNAMGQLFLRRGMYQRAERHFRQAVQRLTSWHPNGHDGEPWYHLGLVLAIQGMASGKAAGKYAALSYDAFAKSAWNYAWRGAAHYQMSCLCALMRDWSRATEHCREALRCNAEHCSARSMLCACLRHRGLHKEGVEIATAGLKLDPLDYFLMHELALLRRAIAVEQYTAKSVAAWGGASPIDEGQDPKGSTKSSGDEAPFATMLRMMRCDPQTVLDVVFNYCEGGMWVEAQQLLQRLVVFVTGSTVFEDGLSDPVGVAPPAKGNVTSDPPSSSIHPMIIYTLAFCNDRIAQTTTSVSERERAKDRAAKSLEYGRALSPDRCFPSRLMEEIVLRWALAECPNDAKAHMYLGHLLYDGKRHHEAISHWERSIETGPAVSSVAYRNLGMAFQNVHRDSTKAMEYYTQALALDPLDARVLAEMDQLAVLMKESPERRMERLIPYLKSTASRDDLSVELCAIYSMMGKFENALQILESRRFHPWEGGEGRVIQQFVATHIMMAVASLESADVSSMAKAIEHLKAALVDPAPFNLGEARHILSPQANAHYHFAWAHRFLSAHATSPEDRDDHAQQSHSFLEKIVAWVPPGYDWAWEETVGAAPVPVVTSKRNRRKKKGGGGGNNPPAAVPVEAKPSKSSPLVAEVARYLDECGSDDAPLQIYYRALALAALKRQMESKAVVEGLALHHKVLTERSLKEESQVQAAPNDSPPLLEDPSLNHVDYFATSVPHALVFRPEPSQSGQAAFVSMLVSAGRQQKDHFDEAAALLQSQNPNHFQACAEVEKLLSEPEAHWTDAMDTGHAPGSPLFMGFIDGCTLEHVVSG